MRIVAITVILAAPFAALPAFAGVDGIVGEVSQASYSNYLNNQLFTHNGDNRGYNSAQHDIVRGRIFDHFQSLGLTTSLHAFNYNGGTYYNVVGTLAGETTDTYVVGSHYDSVSNPGADDNASGTAGVMEAARVLSGHKFKNTLKFIAFDCEELGLIGSQWYVNDLGSSDMKGMVSLDMIAYNYLGGNAVDLYGRDASAAVKNGLSDAITKYGNGLTSVQHDAFDASDHAPFEWRGIPAALMIEKWGNPYYHTQLDSVDTPNYIDYVYATNMTRSAVGYLATSAAPVPEPATMAVLGLGLAGLVARRRRR